MWKVKLTGFVPIFQFQNIWPYLTLSDLHALKISDLKNLRICEHTGKIATKSVSNNYTRVKFPAFAIHQPMSSQTDYNETTVTKILPTTQWKQYTIMNEGNEICENLNRLNKFQL